MPLPEKLIYKQLGADVDRYMTWWKRLGLKIACLTSFPYFLRKIINILDIGLKIKTGRNVTISNDCIFSGDISLGDEVHIGPQTRLVGNIDLAENVELQHSHNVVAGNVEIGAYTYFTEDCDIYGDVSIGRYCAFGPGVSVWEENHLTSGPSQGTRVKKIHIEDPNIHETKGAIDIGHDVWIGNEAIILPGTSVGTGAVVGAGAVVTKDIEPYSIYVGNPAQRVDWRFNQQIRNELLNLEWWYWPQTKIARHSDFFSSDLTKYDSIFDILEIED